MTPSDGVFTSVPRRERQSSAAMNHEPNEPDVTTDTGSEDDFRRTNEMSAFEGDALESTATRPQHPSEISTARGLDQTGTNPAAVLPGEDEEEVVVADDLADLIEVNEPEVEEDPIAAEADPTEQGDKPRPKASSLPPPLPRT